MSYIKAADREYIVDSEDMNEYLADDIVEQMVDLDSVKQVLKSLVLGDLSNSMLYEKLFNIAWRVEQELHRKNKAERGECGAV